MNREFTPVTTTPPEIIKTAKPDIFDELLAGATTARVIEQSARPNDAQDPLGYGLSLASIADQRSANHRLVPHRIDFAMLNFDQAHENASRIARLVLGDVARGGSGESMDGGMNGRVITYNIVAEMTQRALNLSDRA